MVADYRTHNEQKAQKGKEINLQWSPKPLVDVITGKEYFNVILSAAAALYQFSQKIDLNLALRCLKGDTNPATITIGGGCDRDYCDEQIPHTTKKILIPFERSLSKV